MSTDALIRLEAITERITFHSDSSGYCVLRVHVKGHRDLVTVVGVVSTVIPGENLECLGHWVQNKEYGKQFQAKVIRTVPPSTLEGIEKYLSSGMVKGIGPHFASKLVQAFGADVFDVIENQPEKLRGVGGLGIKRIEKIEAAWKEQKMIRSIMVFLQSHGVSTSKAVRIFKTYGDSAVEKVRENPYQLARDIYGIGFKSADLIASQLGIAKESLIRARAGLHYVLMECIQVGHCAYPMEELLDKAVELLVVNRTILQQALEEELKEAYFVKETIRDQICIYPSTLYRCEIDVAQRLNLFMQGVPSWGTIDCDRALEWVQKKTQITLAPLQKKAVIIALKSKFTLITGGPGTGKSTLTKAILTILNLKQVRIALCSPTGRAAKRLSECTGLVAKTIHRTLGFDPKKGGFLHREENPLPIDLLLVDETSMVDIQLAQSLLKAIPQHAAVILVGDVDQLPSVGPGRFLSDLIDSQMIPTVKLQQVFRQAAESKIIQAAHQINQGYLPELEHQANSDFYFITSENPEGTVQKIIDLVKNRIPAKLGVDPIRDIQVLCPMQRGVLGARNLNIELQKVLNPNPEHRIEKFGYSYAVGDKVMVLQNEYQKGVFNGDMGVVVALDFGEESCLIQFDEQLVSFEFSELDILQPAYTITIHKSQGSEYPAVVIPIATQHYMMLKRNLIYTGVTRGKKLVVLIGQKKALAIAVKSFNQQERFTHLAQRIKNSVPHKQF